MKWWIDEMMKWWIEELISWGSEEVRSALRYDFARNLAKSLSDLLLNSSIYETNNTVYNNKQSSINELFIEAQEVLNSSNYKTRIRCKVISNHQWIRYAMKRYNSSIPQFMKRIIRFIITSNHQKNGLFIEQKQILNNYYRSKNVFYLFVHCLPYLF